MLKDIPVLLNVDYLEHQIAFKPKELTIFTGPIDEYFGFKLGRLAYRGQTRRHQYLPDTHWAQPCGQVNNPSPENGPHIRSLEWKHMMPTDYAGRIQGTVITTETTHSPTNPSQYEYPFPDEANKTLYEVYRLLAQGQKHLLVCGRLGEYRYFDMDQAIARALQISKKVLAQVPEREIVQ
jgi:UDP-galactopyranose mutase